MRLIPLTLALTLVACTPQHWRAVDVTLESAVAVTIVLDHSQTVDIVEDCMESNAIIGRCGTRVHPHIYFPTAILLHYLGTRALPMPARIGLEVVTLAVQAWNVNRNAEHGYPP